MEHGRELRAHADQNCRGSQAQQIPERERERELGGAQHNHGQHHSGKNEHGHAPGKACSEKHEALRVAHVEILAHLVLQTLLRVDASSIPTALHLDIAARGPEEPSQRRYRALQRRGGRVAPRGRQRVPKRRVMRGLGCGQRVQLLYQRSPAATPAAVPTALPTPRAVPSAIYTTATGHRKHLVLRSLSLTSSLTSPTIPARKVVLVHILCLWRATASGISVRCKVGSKSCKCCGGKAS
mmetsp:Transcript_11963/g.32190  ORF Transcript_11963/g.32190 Transcript_11963/m.32190 type:complete len:239 (+) Transcript_11963:222-938(+)